jgi:hypothetical protein
VHALLAHPHHLLGQVDGDDAGRGAVRHLAGHAGGTAGHVQHRAGWGLGPDDRVDHRPAPAAVLAERQRKPQPVVPARQPVEEPLGELCRAAS